MSTQGPAHRPRALTTLHGSAAVRLAFTLLTFTLARVCLRRVHDACVAQPVPVCIARLRVERSVRTMACVRVSLWVGADEGR